MDKEIHTIPKGIILKVNITWLEFELAYNSVIIQHISHYTMRISSTDYISWYFLFFLHSHYSLQKSKVNSGHHFNQAVLSIIKLGFKFDLRAVLYLNWKALTMKNKLDRYFHGKNLNFKSCTVIKILDCNDSFFFLSLLIRI